MQTYTAIAHTNIALIKYWGKKDDKLIIPFNNSLSLTLDRFYTKTSAQPITSATDSFVLDGLTQSGAALSKVTRFLDILRAETGSTQKLAINSTNHVPTAAGLASSASGFAALTLASCAAFGLQLSRRTLSRLARRGSGSACRSIYGGFVEWEKGQDNLTSFATPLAGDEQVDLDIAMIALVVSEQAKKVTSRQGMATTVATSPFYPAFVKSCEGDLLAIKQAIGAQDLEKVGQIAESNALKMHATNLGATPPFSYFLPETLVAIAAIQQLRAKGFLCYFTMDAGPNVKVICRGQEAPKIQAALQALLPNTEMLVAYPGPGAAIVNSESLKEAH